MGRHGIATVGGDGPALILLAPSHALYFGLKAGVLVQVEGFANGSAVGQDFRGVGVFFLGNEIKFFTKGEVNVGLNVAGGAGITVPVPGAAKVTTFLDNTHLGHTGFGEPSAGQQPAETAANDNNVNMIC